MEPINSIAHELVECINALWENIPKCLSADSLLVLSKTPISLKQTHRYSQLFLSKPTDLFIDTCGIGKFLVTLKRGWNDVSLPVGTTIALASDGSLSALYRCIDTLP